MAAIVDVDVLVPGERFDDAAALLGELGFRRRSVESRPGFDRRFGKGATFSKDDAANVDLHRTLVAGPYAFLIDPSDLYDSPAHFELSGTRLAALSPEARFIHTCISATLSDSEPKLITLRDVVQTSRDPTLDRAELRRLCARWHIGDVVNSTMSTVNESLGLEAADALPGDLATPESSATARIAEWAYRGQEKRWRRQSLAAIPFIPGWAERVPTRVPVSASRSRPRLNVTSARSEPPTDPPQRRDASTFLEPPRIPTEDDASNECKPIVVDGPLVGHLLVGRPRFVQRPEAIDVEHRATRRMITDRSSSSPTLLTLVGEPIEPVRQLISVGPTLDDFWRQDIRHRVATDRPIDALVTPPPLGLLGGELRKCEFSRRVPKLYAEALLIRSGGLRLRPWHCKQSDEVARVQPAGFGFTTSGSTRSRSRSWRGASRIAVAERQSPNESTAFRRARCSR